MYKRIEETEFQKTSFRMHAPLVEGLCMVFEQELVYVNMLGGLLQFSGHLCEQGLSVLTVHPFTEALPYAEQPDRDE